MGQSSLPMCLRTLLQEIGMESLRCLVYSQSPCVQLSEPPEMSFHLKKELFLMELDTSTFTLSELLARLSGKTLEVTATQVFLMVALSMAGQDSPRPRNHLPQHWTLLLVWDSSS